MPALIEKLAGFVMPGLGKVIDDLVPDPHQAAAIKVKLNEAFLAADVSEFADEAGIITAEAKSEHWLTATWRPLTMMVFTSIVAMNYLVLPVAAWFHLQAQPLPMPQDLWDLLKIGLGGYIVGRSAEKVLPAVAAALKAGS